MGLPTPYYDRDGITLYHGDCREILPLLDPVDAIVTDPPYGIGEAAGKNKSRSVAALSKDFGNEDWDEEPPPEWLFLLMRERSRWQVIFGGNYFPLPPSSCWLVWDKDNGDNDFADCELAWTNLRKAVRRVRYRWQGMLQQNMAAKEPRWHPTQKPLDVMAWVIGHLPDGVSSVLDPYAGSGTTLVAAKQAGMSAIGIEQSERYCEIAVDRLRQKAIAWPEAPE